MSTIRLTFVEKISGAWQDAADFADERAVEARSSDEKTEWAARADAAEAQPAAVFNLSREVDACPS